MNPSASPAEARADLMAGVIEHLACFIQSGRPRSAKLATLLLDRLAQAIFRAQRSPRRSGVP